MRWKRKKKTDFMCTEGLIVFEKGVRVRRVTWRPGFNGIRAGILDVGSDKLG